MRPCSRTVTWRQLGHSRSRDERRICCWAPRPPSTISRRQCEQNECAQLSTLGSRRKSRHTAHISSSRTFSISAFCRSTHIVMNPPAIGPDTFSPPPQFSACAHAHFLCERNSTKKSLHLQTLQNCTICHMVVESSGPYSAGESFRWSQQQ